MTTPHIYRPFTTRDGSEACADCHAGKDDPIHNPPESADLYLCDSCSAYVISEDGIELPGDDEHIFCSDGCAEAWDDAQRDTDPLY